MFTSASLGSPTLNPQKHEGQLSVMQLMDMLTGVASGTKYLTEMGFVHKRLAAHKVSEVPQNGRAHNRKQKAWLSLNEFI